MPAVTKVRARDAPKAVLRQVGRPSLRRSRATMEANISDIDREEIVFKTALVRSSSILSRVLRGVLTR
jgi:hypothetical protein